MIVSDERMFVMKVTDPSGQRQFRRALSEPLAPVSLTSDTNV